jgi:hypothetical protein
MRGKKAKALRKLVYRDHDGSKTKYVAQEHLVMVPGSPEMAYQRITVLATGHRRIYKDVKLEIKRGKRPR